MLHGQEKFHHYCFTKEVSIIPYNKPLVAIFKEKEVKTLLQRLLCVLLRKHQYKTGYEDKTIEKNKDEELRSMIMTTDTEW